MESLAYALTTVPERFSTTLLPTLDSLAKGGFPRPLIFVDGCVRPEQYDVLKPHLDVIPRTIRMGAVSNWFLTLQELYQRHPAYLAYAVFQDDISVCKNLRPYLDKTCPIWLGKVYANLFSFRENEELVIGQKGWVKSDQMGRSATALFFNRDAVRTLLMSKHFYDKAVSSRAQRAIDGAVSECLGKQNGWTEMIHAPSLVQHRGALSTMGNNRHDAAKTFPGEGFDCLTLLTGHQDGNPTQPPASDSSGRS